MVRNYYVKDVSWFKEMFLCPLFFSLSVSGRQEKVPLCDVNSCLELREMSQEQESIVGDETSEPPDPKLVDFPAELKVLSVQKIIHFFLTKFL